jgi:hypothetical protein
MHHHLLVNYGWWIFGCFWFEGMINVLPAHTDRHVFLMAAYSEAGL